MYDFTDIKKKKIIEYNGDQYHANPSIYDKDDLPHPYHKEKGYTYKDIWERDKIKIDLARKMDLMFWSFGILSIEKSTTNTTKMYRNYQWII